MIPKDAAQSFLYHICATQLCCQRYSRATLHSILSHKCHQLFIPATQVIIDPAIIGISLSCVCSCHEHNFFYQQTRFVFAVPRSTLFFIPEWQELFSDEYLIVSSLDLISNPTHVVLEAQACTKSLVWWLAESRYLVNPDGWTKTPGTY